MAIRRFEIPGKIIRSDPAIVNPGPAGEFSIDLNSGGGIFLPFDDLNGSVNVKKFTLAMWWYPLTNLFQNIVSGNEIEDNQNSSLQIGMTTGSNRKIQIIGDSSPTINAASLVSTSTDAVFTLNAWNSILISVDVTAATATLGVKVWVNDLTANMINSTFNSGGFAFDTPNSAMSFGHDVYGANTPDGNFGSIWCDFGRSVDFDITANRRLFVGADKRPVSLGPTGARPFGVPPLMYFDNGPSAYATNRGSGADFRYNTDETPDTNGFIAATTTPATGTLA